METNLSIQESQLELVVSEKTLGSLTTNAKQIRDMVKEALPMYDISNYDDSNIDQAKKDKASLNKAAKTLNSKRLEIEKEFMKPFVEFKEVVTETVKLIGECSAKIDTVVKQNEQIYKDKKLADIRTYFDALNKSFISFNKVFKQEWLNKSKSMKSVCVEIDTIFTSIENDINALKSFDEDFDVLRTYYLETLNVTATIQYANRLKEQREIVKVEEEERIKAEEERKRLEEESRNNREQETNVERPANQFERVNQEMNEAPAYATEAAAQVQKEQHTSPVMYTRAFKVTGTREQIIALGDFMNDNGIDFEKIQL